MTGSAQAGVRRRPSGIVIVLLWTALAVAACSTPSAVTTSSAPPTTAQPKPKLRPVPLFYVSLGDSYAAGYQPTGSHIGHTDTNGFAYQVPVLAAKKGYDLKLVNFGCAGATTSSILFSRGCLLLGPGAPPYPRQSQATAAESFLATHRGSVGLVTVSIGGNDVTRCALVVQVISCVAAALTGISENLGELLRGLRAAAGPSVPIVGTTYPDVILGLALSRRASLRSIARLSVTAFKLLINPELKKQYQAVGAKFVDVTAATGAYDPFTDTTNLPPYGMIPVAVAKVCELTFFCKYHDIHPRTAGYRVIADLVVGTLARHR